MTSFPTYSLLYLGLLPFALLHCVMPRAADRILRIHHEAHPIVLRHELSDKNPPLQELQDTRKLSLRAGCRVFIDWYDNY
jgi:hypothetical protein